MLTRSLATLPMLLAALSACSCGGAPPMPEPDPVVTCTATEKYCDDRCVGLDRPDFGCGRSSCDACNHYAGNTHWNEVFTCSAANACELVNCNSGGDGLRADCDLNILNGCELDLTEDLRNCGACGNACPDTPPDGASTTTCSSGQCKAACRTGHVDSDGLLENGCEGTVQFVEGDIDDCPAAPPTDGSVCDDVGSCHYYTPGSACVTNATCQILASGGEEWNVGAEQCNGRFQGAFCELDLECASGGCAENECLTNIGYDCTMDDQCGSGACCPTNVNNTFDCQTACALRPVGDDCSWGAQCESGTCDNYECGP